MEIQPTIGKSLIERLSKVVLFVFDIDGVLTDGGLWVSPAGEITRRVDIKDGYAIQYAIKKGYTVVLISGARGEGVGQRFARLGVKRIYTGVVNKLPVFEKLLNELHIPAWATLYMGDDIPDIPVLRKAGVAACPQDAAVEVQSICHYIATKKGGHGCAREVIELVLRLHGRWGNADSFLW